MNALNGNRDYVPQPRKFLGNGLILPHPLSNIAGCANDCGPPCGIPSDLSG